MLYNQVYSGLIFNLLIKKFFWRAFGVKENNKYQIKFEFKNGESYTLSYSYDSKAQAIKYGDGLVSSELKEKLGKQVLDLESALIHEMIRENSNNVTDDSVSLYKEQIKNNLEKIDLGEDFLIDIMPDIFSLKNLCKNNLEVVYPDNSYVELDNKRVKVSGRYQDVDCQNKSEQIVDQVKKIHEQNGNKKITFVEKMIFAANWDDDEHPKNEISPSWIFTYIYKKGYGNYGIYYEDLKSIEYFKETQGHDSQKSENNEKISLGGKIARIIFLILLIAFAIFLPTYLGIVGLLFSNVAIPIIVFSAEAILITLIIIFILSIRNIDNENNLLQKQIGLGEGEFSTSEQEKLMDKGKNEKEPKNNPEPNQLIKNNGQNLGEHIQNDK